MSLDQSCFRGDLRPSSEGRPARYEGLVHITGTAPIIDVDVTTQGPLPGAADYARRKIGGLAKFVEQRDCHARVRLTNHTCGHRPRPVVAQANLEVAGRRIRAQVEAESVSEAIDTLHDRLRGILERQRRRSRRDFGGHTGHHGLPAVPRRPSESPGSDGPRILRRKSFSVAQLSVDEAAEEMSLLDYHFHLFIEKATAIASVLYRVDAGGYRLAQVVSPSRSQLAPFDLPLTISPHSAPCITLTKATERIELLGLPFLFFIDAAEGRAKVLYHRYDGHYGLITPA